MDKYDGPGLHTLREHLKELRAERDSLRNQRDQEQAWRERLQESELREHHKLLAAEARVEALEPVLEAAEAFIEARWLGSREALEKSVRAALAAALPERQTAGPGCERHRGDPHNLCEACWAVEPPAALHNPQETNQ